MFLHLSDLSTLNRGNFIRKTNRRVGIVQRSAGNRLNE